MTVDDPRRPLLEGRAGPLVTVYGPPGVGTSTLVRAAFPSYRVLGGDQTVDDLRACRGPVIWDDVDPAVAAEAWHEGIGSVVVASTGRTRRSEEQAVRIDPLPETVIAEILTQHGPSVPGLAARCLGLPGLAVRAHELQLLLGRLPTASDWLRLGPLPGHPSPRQALERHVGRVRGVGSLLELVAAFRGPFTLADLEVHASDDPLVALGLAVDAGVVVPGDDGSFEMPPLHRAWFDERPAVSEARRGIEQTLGAASPAMVEALERDGTTPAVAHRFADLLAVAEARVPGWRAALWLATAQRPTEVPRPLLAAARIEAPDDSLVARALARHLRSTGALSEAEELLVDIDDPGARRELGALHHRARRLDQAEALYRTDVGRSRRADALRHANLAAVAHDRGDLAEAEQGYARALRELSMHGDERNTGVIASNLGALRAETGDLDGARASLGRAVRSLASAGEPRLWSIAAGNLAWLDARTGAGDRAMRLLRRALTEGAPDERTAATLWMRIAAVHASRGELDGARDAFDAVDTLLHGTEDRFALELAELFRAFLHLAEGRRLEALEALERAASGVLVTSDDARTAAAWVRELLQRRPGQSLVVGPDGTYVRLPDGTSHAVSNGAARRILDGLAERWSPSGVGVDLEGLFELGWPGERAVPSAQKNRVHVALSALRKAGLKPFIVRDEGGHLLDPAVPVLRGG